MVGWEHEVLRREARAAGLARHGQLSLADVESRRSQLWAVAFLAIIVLAAAVAIGAGSDEAAVVARLPAFRIGVVILMAALGAYVVEKEVHLRRLTRMFVAERALNVSLAHEIAHDPLTGLLNRATFRHHLDAAVVRARVAGSSLAVLFLDLDRFKEINDTFGHTVGDELLVQSAGRLRHTVRDRDTLARHGGDEFTVLLEGIDGGDEAVAIAERIQDAFAEPFVVETSDQVVGISVGVTVSVGGQDDAETLLREADVAMYLAKRAGRARYEVFQD